MVRISDDHLRMLLSLCLPWCWFDAHNITLILVSLHGRLQWMVPCVAFVAQILYDEVVSREVKKFALSFLVPGFRGRNNQKLMC